MGEGNSLKETIQNGKALTAGVVVDHGIHSLNHLDIQESIAAVVEKKINEEKTTRKRKRKEKLERIAKVVNLRQLGKDPSTWNAMECKAFLQYKKRETDSAMPTKINGLRSRCEEVKNRSSPTKSVHASDDEDNDVEHVTIPKVEELTDTPASNDEILLPNKSLII